jgi:hypothetical protein
LQDAAHDVDRGVVPVKQRRSSDEAHFLRGLVVGEGLEFGGQVRHAVLRKTDDETNGLSLRLRKRQS